MTPEEEMMFRQRLQVAAQDDNALAAGQPQPGLAPPQAPGMSGLQEFKNRLSGSGRRLLGSPALLGPMGAGLARSAMGPTLREPTSFVRDQPEEIKPMDVPLAEAAPVPTLDERLSKLPQMGAAGIGGMGGGAPSGLAGARDRFLSAESNIVGDLDTEKDLTLQKGDQQIERIKQQAMDEHILAARQERDAQIQQAEEARAAQRHEEFLAKNEQMAEEIGKQKIDPHRLFRDKNAGEQFLFILGGAFGGMLQGLQGGGQNDFLARAERMVDRDIRAQEADIDNKKAALSARNSLFGQMLQQHGDRRLAAQQTKNAIYESAKLHMQAKAAEAQTPEMKTNAELAANAFQMKQDELTTSIAQRSYQNEMAKAQAAAAATSASENKQWQRAKEMAELALKGDELALKKLEIVGKADEKNNAALGEATKRLADDDVVKNRDLVNSLTRKINPETGEIVGLSRSEMAAGRASDTTGWNAVNPYAYAAKALVGPSTEQRTAQQEFKQLKLLYQNKVTGSGGSDAQMKQIAEAFEGAGTMEEKKRVILMAKADLDRREALAQAALTDQQKALLQQRLGREGNVDMPKSVTVKK